MRDRRVVLVLRSTEPLKGEWSIPGGALELGETLRQGAVREALEETGLEVKAGEIIEVFDRIYPDPDGRIRYHYVLVDFLCTPLSGELRAGGDAAEARWVSLEELPQFNLTETATRIIHKALKNP